MRETREKTSFFPPKKRTTKVSNFEFDDDIERIVGKYQRKEQGEAINYTAKVTTTITTSEVVEMAKTEAKEREEGIAELIARLQKHQRQARLPAHPLKRRRSKHDVEEPPDKRRMTAASQQASPKPAPSVMSGQGWDELKPTRGFFGLNPGGFFGFNGQDFLVTGFNVQTMQGFLF